MNTYLFIYYLYKMFSELSHSSVNHLFTLNLENLITDSFNRKSNFTLK